MVLAAVVHVARYGIPHSRQGYPRITQLQGYGVFTPLPNVATHNIINSAYMTDFFYDGDLNVGLVWLAIQRQHEVDWAYVTRIMEDPFHWYD